MLYRSEIDGLRAIAVLAVILYHFYLPGFSGGFIGVDLFFVISGYLITGKIQNSLNTKSFRYLDFYAGRVRRLFPALLVTVVCSVALAKIFFRPDHLADTALSAIAAVTGFSNFYFAETIDYFRNGQMAPLLHTWSLGVEEQFYLLWPIMVLFLATRKPHHSIVWLLSLAIFITIAAEAMLAISAAHAFYWMPFRIAEFAIGAMVTYLTPFFDFSTTRKGRISANFFAGIGLLIVGLCIVEYKRHMVFPGTLALIPCLAIATIILCGSNTIVAKALSFRPATYVGKISYSLYLVHWPLTVICAAGFQKSSFSRIEKIMLFALIFVVSELLHRFVERQFRFNIGPRVGSRRLLGGTIVVVLLTIGGLNYVKVGANKTPQPAFSFSTGTGCMATESFSTDRKRILILGDSHAMDLFNAICANRERFAEYEFRLYRLNPRCITALEQKTQAYRDRDSCNDTVNGLFKSTTFIGSDYLVYAALWGKSEPELIPDFNRVIEKYGKKLIVLGDTPSFFDGPTIAYLNQGKSHQEVAKLFSKTRSSRVTNINNQLASIAAQNSIVYKDRTSIVCPDDMNCTLLNENGDLLYADSNHWTQEGAKYFGARIADMQFFDDIL